MKNLNTISSTAVYSFSMIMYNRVLNSIIIQRHLIAETCFRKPCSFILLMLFYLLLLLLWLLLLMLLLLLLLSETGFIYLRCRYGDGTQRFLSSIPLSPSSEGI